MPKIAVFVLCCMVPFGAVQAQTVFDVKLAGKRLGTLSYGKVGDVGQMTTTLSNTPLGVFNGAMRATSEPKAGRQTFTSITGAEGKARTVVVAHKSGRAVETLVEPAAQLTPLSDPKRVPAGIVDPVQAIGQMIASQTCPEKITIYDGRRAIALTLTEKRVKDGTEICNLSYRVVAGPPHLSPLNVSRAKMKLIYATAGGRTLARIEVSHGVFRVKLERRD